MCRRLRSPQLLAPCSPRQLTMVGPCCLSCRPALSSSLSSLLLLFLSLHCVALRRVASRRVASRRVALRCVALFCFVLFCFVVEVSASLRHIGTCNSLLLILFFLEKNRISRRLLHDKILRDFFHCRIRSESPNVNKKYCGIVWYRKFLL